jgi:hypothetical protein
MDHEDGQKPGAFEKRVFRLAVYETPGTILVVLGAYAKFWADGNAFMPVLNNPAVHNAMLAIGLTIWLATWTEFFKLFKKNKR